MKLRIFGLLLVALFIASCERVAPNYQGVLMENWGKNGKSDFTLQKGRVNTWSPGTELFQVPLWEQRASFEKEMHLQDADRTEYTVNPSYTYKVIESRAVDVVFQNKHLGSGDDFMKELENNILEPAIYDISKDICRTITTENLTSSGASLKFELTVKELVSKKFNEKGLELETFTLQLVPSEKVRAKIDARSEVNTNITVIDQEIEQQKKQNLLAELKAQENIILSKGLTPQILEKMKIEAWAKYGAKTPIVSGSSNVVVTVPEIK